MSKFIEKLNLKGMADEDIYFAKRDRELIDALHKKKLKKVVDCAEEDEKALAKQYEKRFEKISDKHKHKPKKLARAFRDLVDEILELCAMKKDKESNRS